MAMVLQQTLRSLCFRTSWCYAVFWKLKRRSRMVLTWEDGFYEYRKSSAVSSSVQKATNSRLAGGNGCVETGGNPLDQGVTGHEASYLEEQISLAVAKMSYHVYSLGEGIIGRVAFTGKHQWVFGGGENCSVEAGSGAALSNRCMLEKYPAGWQNQFAAGIKTIAVIAVPQGVVQLGSTQTIMEDLEWVEHIKSVFGALQCVPGAFLSDYVSEGQGGKSSMPTPVMSAVSPSATVGRPTSLHRSQAPLRNVKSVTASATALRSLGCGSLGRVGSVQGSPHIQVLPPMNELSNATNAMLQQSEHQQDFTQSSTCSFQMASEARDSRTAVAPSGAQTLQSLTSVVQLDVPSVSNQQMPLPTSDIGSSCLKMMEERLLEESCFKEYTQPSSTVFTTDMQPQVDADVSTGLRDGILLEKACNQEQSSNSGRLVADKISGLKRSDSLFGIISVNGASHQQMKAAPMNVQTPLGGHTNAPSTHNSSATTRGHFTIQNQLSLQAIGLPTNQSLKQNLVPFVEDNMSSQDHAREAVQTPGASWSVSAEHLNSNLFDCVGVSATFQGSLCSSDSVLDQNGWAKEGWGKSTSNCVSQSTTGGLRHARGGHKHSEVTVGSIGHSSLPAGGFDDLEKYLTSFSQGQDKKWDRPYAIGDELSQALGPAFKKGHDKEFWEEILLHSGGDQSKEVSNQHTLGITGGSTNQSDAEIIQSLGSSPSEDEFSKSVFGVYLSENKAEPLLEAVVGNASSIHQSASTNPDDSFSCKTTFSGLDSGVSVLNSMNKADSKSRVHNAAPECLSKDYMLGVPHHEDIGNLHNVTLVSDSQGKLELQRSSNDSSSKVMLSTWTEEGQSIKSENTQPSQVKKPEETVKVSRKRARPGESTRPRPKDRQQIQDRVRELRDIVPNGSKCSIDALLEKTIKHMLFLQSVTQHADKLKQSGQFKVPNKENSLLAQDDMEGGASWALEVGGHGVGCPIVVENLNQPRQMLVEMLCEERGAFLEIADTIRNLGLTILKGVMESRTDKIWARFVVEADRDVHRVDVLLPLVQLLQLNNNKTSSSSTMTMGSQAGIIRPQQGIDSSTQTFCGFQQASFSERLP